MKIAFIGAGWVASRHLINLANETNLEIVGHVSPVKKELDAAVKRWGGRGYASMDGLLAHEKIDAAWITVPPGEHGEIEKALIEKGIPIFIEKPLSADRETGEKIGAMLQEKSVIAAVGYHWRAMDTIPEVKKCLSENPVRMVLGAWHDSTPPPEWWRHQNTSGGQVVEQATHLFDLARCLIGEATVKDAIAFGNFRQAYPDSDIANVSAALVNFSYGVPGVFSATCVLGGPAEIYVKFICEGMLITITQAGVIIETGREKREIRLGNDPFLTEDRIFIQAIQKNDASLLLSSYQDALKTHALCHDVLEKYRPRTLLSSQ